MRIITGSTGTAHVTSADDRQFNCALFGTGDVVLPLGNQFAYTLESNNSITIADGDLCMGGCHARINAGQTETLTISSGTAGKVRIDLVCARYTLNASTGYEKVELVIVKGTPSSSIASTPSINDTTKINAGAAIYDMPLYRIKINGISVSKVEKLFDTAMILNDSIATAYDNADKAAKSVGNLKFVALTEAAYESLSSYDANTVYFIK